MGATVTEAPAKASEGLMPGLGPGWVLAAAGAPAGTVATGATVVALPVMRLVLVVMPVGGGMAGAGRQRGDRAGSRVRSFGQEFHGTDEVLNLS